MAITDGLIAHVYAETGDATIIDKVSGGALTGTGTKSIVDVSGEKAWNLTSASYEMGFTSRAVNPSGTTPVDGVTFAYRYRLNVMGANDLSSFVGISTDTPTEAIMIQRNGTSAIRARYKTTTVGTDSDLATTATVHTVVMVYRPNELSTSGDYIRCWKNTVGRVGTGYDFGATGFTGAPETYDRLFFKAPDTMDVDVLDLIYWDRSLTDAEAAAVADDLRAELPVGGGSDTTVNATLATISVSTYTATVVTSSSSTIVNATLGAIGVSAFDATIVTEASITTDILKNNTGTVLASTSGIIASVYDLSTGALVVRKTGLTSDGSGVVTFSDVSLSNGTEYLVTITIATADGVARITAG